MVERIFFAEKIFQEGAASDRADAADFIKKANVTASTEGLFCAAVDDYGANTGVFTPGQQLCGEGADHFQ